MADPIDPLPTGPETPETVDFPADPIEELACAVVLIAAVLVNLLTEKRPRKSAMALDVFLSVEHLKTRFPRSFPPVAEEYAAEVKPREPPSDEESGGRS